MDKTRFNLKNFKTIYTGSVKNLHAKIKPTDAKEGIYIFEFTDDYSVFDYGKMPDTLPGKGAALAIGTARLFELLESAASWQDLAYSAIWRKIRDHRVRERLLKSKALEDLTARGLKTHYRGLIDSSGRRVRTDALTEPTNLMEVRAVRIVHPKPLVQGNRTLWNYNGMGQGMRNILVPLENVFRFGIPTGSSLLERLEDIADYHLQLGLRKKPSGGDWLPFPVVEFFSKLEPSDRFLTYETALNYSGLGNKEFTRLLDTTSLVAMFLLHFYEKAGIKLWDGKLEFVRMGGLVLGDAITPDELRLTFRGVQISKEPLRQYYRRYHAPFLAAIKRAKDISAKTGEPLGEILRNRLRVRPANLSEDFREAAAGMYTALCAKTTGIDVFEKHPSLPQVLEVFKRYKVA